MSGTAHIIQNMQVREVVKLAAEKGAASVEVSHSVGDLTQKVRVTWDREGEEIVEVFGA